FSKRRTWSRAERSLAEREQPMRDLLRGGIEVAIDLIELAVTPSVLGAWLEDRAHLGRLLDERLDLSFAVEDARRSRAHERRAERRDLVDFEDDDGPIEDVGCDLHPGPRACRASDRSVALDLDAGLTKELAVEPDLEEEPLEDRLDDLLSRRREPQSVDRSERALIEPRRPRHREVREHEQARRRVGKPFADDVVGVRSARRGLEEIGRAERVAVPLEKAAAGEVEGDRDALIRAEGRVLAE